MLAACRKWLKARKDTPVEKRDALLRKYLGSQADVEEGCTLFHIHNSFVLSKGLLYISTMPKEELEGVSAFLVPPSQCTTALNSIHWDAGHQGQERRLSLVQERFWWPVMVEDCKALVRGSPRCRVFEGVIPRAPVCPMRAHTPLELVHVDFTSVESTMELNKPPSIKNVLVITDHFMCYALAVMRKDQTAKTVAKVLYERFIAVFGMPAKLLSDWGANFTSTLVEELCTAFKIQKCQTITYHPQCNRQIKHFHQTFFRMIGKLASDKKVQWQQHLPELLQACNSIRSAITSYSPHYLMFGRCPCLPVDFYFPTKGAHVRSCCVPAYVEEVRKHFKEAYTEAHLQTNSEAYRQKWYYDRATSTMQIMLGDIILMKLEAFQVKRKAKDRWSEVEYMVTRQVINDVPVYEVRDDGRNVNVAHHNRLFLVAPTRDVATPLGGEASPFPMWAPSVALRSTVCGLSSGEGTSSFSDEDVH